MIGEDLLRIGAGAAVADQDGAGDFLVQHHAHFLLHPGHDVEVGDIDDIVAIELLQLVHGLRSRHTAQGCDLLLDLLAALDVTLGAGLLLRQVDGGRLDAGERALLHAVENDGDPLHAANDLVRLAVDGLGFGEQDLDIRDAVLQRGFLEAAVTGCVGEDGLDVRVRQDVFLVHVVFENVILHCFSFENGMTDFFVILVFFVIFLSGINERLHCVALLVGHAVYNILDLHGNGIVAILDGCQNSFYCGQLLVVHPVKDLLDIGLVRMVHGLALCGQPDHRVNSIFLLVAESIEALGDHLPLVLVDRFGAVGQKV